MWVVHIPTPSTDKTCYYFWCHLRNYRIHEQGLTRRIMEAAGGILREDEDILEAQQRALNKNPDRDFNNLNIDAGSLWARRRIDDMIHQENSHRIPVVSVA
jgi:vanillate O-demethylase monooxygenase subunit